MPGILELRDVSYRHKEREVLAVEKLLVPRASITGLAGPNGSGKTTLLKLLSFVEKPTSGTVHFYGAKTPAANGDQVRRRLCLLPQETYLLRRSVFENIAYGLKIRGRRERLEALVGEALELVGLPESFAGRQWNELSGGEAQRVALAARLALKPDGLFLDEPTASVDMESARCIRKAVLLARKEWGATLVIASHHRSWLNDICDRIVYLYNGRILDCSFDNILTGPWETAADGRVTCRLSDGQLVYAARSGGGSGSAVIPPEAFNINGTGSGKYTATLQGIITSLALENHCRGPQAHVTCGDQRFLVGIPPESPESCTYWPGEKVTLSYDPDDFVWLKE